ncbi:hypothetical protein [Flavivirga jejuensis]|uniref:Uncharacterized protein n=1 Tax=Flavivirga jejuensis TaxID=870487 RepID=A0ABT8WTG7_9FLAO|nr:hypothetical protein [Flavivirga jejuensis]MDO5976285.1 hypothetical protein [Flavivirga jejuensis]
MIEVPPSKDHSKNLNHIKPKTIDIDDKKNTYMRIQRTYLFRPHYIPGWISLAQVWFHFYFPDF